MRWRAAALALALAGPAVAQPVTPPPRSLVDGLLNALPQAPTEDAAAALEAQIRTQFLEAASPAVRLLLSRGARELSEGAPGDAFDSFEAALDLEPELLEAWRGRARSRAELGDVTGAVTDLQEVLRREPRHYGAWQDLSRVAEGRGDWRGALAAWQKLLEVDPRTPGGQTRLRDLRRRALGEDA